MPERLRSLTVVHDCGVKVRPCPQVECRYHLAKGENPRKFAGRKDQGETCALDVADDGPHSVKEVGDMLGCGRERARQLVERALRKLRRTKRVVESDVRDGWRETDLVSPPRVRVADAVSHRNGLNW